MNHKSIESLWLGGGAKIVEEQDGKTTFSPKNSLKEHLNTEKTPQNIFWSLAGAQKSSPLSLKEGRTKYKR